MTATEIAEPIWYKKGVCFFGRGRDVNDVSPYAARRADRMEIRRRHRGLRQLYEERKRQQRDAAE
jgi:hypothetical protein